ncbi:MAG: hypothetical protein ISR76_08155 [Planctomycetes bacterium]|nr:hypothetical protein [Planctomycetota bacterium]
MTRLLVLTSAGLLSWPLWPEAWRLGLGIGWCCSLALELAVYARRRRLMAAEADARSYQGLLLVQVAGFLAKLLAVAAGGVVGAQTGWYHYPAFLLSFVAGLVLGEAVMLTSLFRATRGAAERPAP